MTILRETSSNETSAPLQLNIASIEVAAGDGYAQREVLGLSLGSTCTYVCNTDATCNGSCCCASV